MVGDSPLKWKYGYYENLCIIRELSLNPDSIKFIQLFFDYLYHFTQDKV